MNHGRPVRVEVSDWSAAAMFVILVIAAVASMDYDFGGSY
jgi:hypothetical protein